ncbi:hypothetical protein [Tessaracoccus oleiagri]|uniref:Alcohol acetyltransferase n=1 Tax=Tessaracoccus oleiagri TaxID=686624 RepID=A0A1G9MHX6_9ACTN|nr:hypothetical protein [Tessaracoccus oleiagri]SDL73799.1 hypothetical protein SAMN04488242_2643 [Tessaracoccus oleiagri]
MRLGAAAARRPWVRLDNAANIFLAARSDVDSKVFRLAAELDEEVDPATLQEALDRVFAQYPLFQAVLRQGVFWYYLQQSELRPVVAEEQGPPVQHLYHHERHELLFRVLYRGRRVSLEVFHALTDGTGALWFFEDLLTEYVGLRHVDEFRAAASDVKQGFTVDAFTHWFRSGSGSVPFEEDATAAVESRTTELPPEAEAPAGREQRRRRHRRRDVLRIRGTHTPDLRTRVVELTMPVKPVLALARTEGVSLTIYLLAVFFEAIRATRLPAGTTRTITCSVPVNLRQFFPTESGRNFFATTMLAHTYTGDEEEDSVSAVCRELDRQFKQVLTKDGLARKIRRLVRFERNPALRVVPRPLKDLILATVNSWGNQGITLAISNLGRVALPEPVAVHVGRLYLQVAAVRPQFGAVSHGDLLTVSFTAPFVETDYQAAFVRHLTGAGVPVEVNASRVTAGELAEVAGPRAGRGEAGR